VYNFTYSGSEVNCKNDEERRLAEVFDEDQGPHRTLETMMMMMNGIGAKLKLIQDNSLGFMTDYVVYATNKGCSFHIRTQMSALHVIRCHLKNKSGFALRFFLSSMCNVG
jgi:hypothetical protein